MFSAVYGETKETYNAARPPNWLLAPWKCRGIGRFEPLTTFGWKLLKHVLAPDVLPHYAGFVVEVSHKKGDG